MSKATIIVTDTLTRTPIDAASATTTATATLTPRDMIKDAVVRVGNRPRRKES
jgi:hypothetical protein